MGFMRRVAAGGDSLDRRVRVLTGMKVRLSSLVWEPEGVVVRDGGRGTPRHALRLEPGGMRVLTGRNEGRFFGWETWAWIAPPGMVGWETTSMPGGSFGFVRFIPGIAYDFILVQGTTAAGGGLRTWKNLVWCRQWGPSQDWSYDTMSELIAWLGHNPESRAAITDPVALASIRDGLLALGHEPANASEPQRNALYAAALGGTPPRQPLRPGE